MFIAEIPEPGTADVRDWVHRHLGALTAGDTAAPLARGRDAGISRTGAPRPAGAMLHDLLLGTIGAVRANHGSTSGNGAGDVNGPGLHCSLRAVTAACEALNSGQFDLVLAGGVAKGVEGWMRGRAAAAGNQVRVYDASPTGSLPGEGCGIVALTRAADARVARGARLRGNRGLAYKLSDPMRGSRLLGSAPAAGAARPVAHYADPLHHRVRLSAIQLCRPDGNPAGFNVELARLICEELKITCTSRCAASTRCCDALAENSGDAVIASIAVTPETRTARRLQRSLLSPPARFVARRDAAIATCGRKARGQEGRGGRRHRARGLSEGVLHRGRAAALSERRGCARRAAQGRGRPSVRRRHRARVLAQRHRLRQDCCAFVGGPFIESRYFGEGVGIAVKRGNDTLRLAFNWALFRLWEKGRFTDLWLRYFPISPF